MLKEIDLMQVREHAQNVYTTGELTCSEAIVKAIMTYVDPSIPATFLNVASGFSEGVGGTKCMCSTISASVLCLGYFFGRDFPTTITDPQSVKTLDLSLEIQEYFRKNNKVSCCSVLRKNVNAQNRPLTCIELVGEMAEKTAEIVAREHKLTVSKSQATQKQGVA